MEYEEGTRIQEESQKNGRQGQVPFSKPQTRDFYLLPCHSCGLVYISQTNRRIAANIDEKNCCEKPASIFSSSITYQNNEAYYQFRCYQRGTHHHLSLRPDRHTGQLKAQQHSILSAQCQTNTKSSDRYKNTKHSTNTRVSAQLENDTD